MIDIWVNMYSDDAYGATIFSFGEKTPISVEGMTRVVMQWIKALGTELGSDLFDPDYGSIFSSLLGSNVENSDTTRETVSIGLQQATESVVRNQQEAVLPDDERLLGHQLVSFTEVDVDSIEIIVSLQNVLNKSMLVGFRL